MTIIRTSFHRHYIWVARLGWTAVLLLTIGMLAANLPHLYRDTANEWVVGEAGPAARQIFSSWNTFIVTVIIFRLVTLATFILTALFLAWRKWDDWFSLYISATMLLLGYFFGSYYNIDVIRYPSVLEQFFPAIRAVAPTLTLISLLLIFYLFPDGRFAPRWLAWFTIPAVIVTLIIFFAVFFINIGWLPETAEENEWGWYLFTFFLFATAAAGLAGQIYRYLRVSDAEQRQQTKWVLFGLGALIISPWLPSSLSSLLPTVGYSQGQLISLYMGTIIPLLLPVTIAFSILRYRLWEVDVWINRAMVYGGLTLFVAAIYILAVGLLSTLVQTRDSLILSILVTGLIAILFNPLRQRLQTAVNRFMYGDRDDPVTVLTALGKRLEETAVPAETVPTLVTTIAQTLNLPYVAIDNGEGEILATSTPQMSPRIDPFSFPLVYQSETIGRLLVSPRAPGEGFNPAEMNLLKNLARQAGTAVFAAQLTVDLQRSREQLVTTREEERLRIRRDLHDGLGPKLATMSLKVDAARNYLERDGDKADRLLGELNSEIQNAIGDIRRLVHDLRPPALDQLGLVSALQEFATGQNGSSPLNITIQAPDPLPSLPAAVEVAAYRIALEAMTNAIRHANAVSCTVTLEIDGNLRLEVRDDGTGLPIDHQAGVGLTSMRERTAELGGKFQIDSNPGRGTTILVHLPLA